ncbi:hypothetical protein A2533_00610 [Candidatus Falkowbacteria bacterium RIFOXYD2_FULL_35_9]|uniref:thioredoxin-dependent peroxiredoxin n=1 Tax=Candidatus Falkowbacteria bacterium RIFOXYC2_FULL_36_12 TaxID=1798002 RepID=A0A1F5SWY0_9BACT|nr:MAG: hypothetical protein A2478_01070 [Candidatus Falkowbacteria bacterium RIFOXYC2_FULL_36_12]OGF31187.1 MAG: hypothetical protein A2300_02970 [Candidatus Falkowbacteria bacterium RIFOXYB2_FULL_35_7]OGF34444.1 MAG: hypothetical protein A2223_02870 [Candidatus Falkowbacteria bacterium RIFOXYA2_FULL_35_8]OGF47561.1 MAG: hypothetical protein A2533_00610 [Candidatus Falkowbacteria bacterium RIFOXYD2_FULL_35_9]
MSELKIGDVAPDFTLPDQMGAKHRLGDYKNQWVLIYFYPKDNTPGCIQEACSIRDNYSEFGKIKAVILGISADSIESHNNFSEKHKLPFTILSDEKKKILEKYGVWQKKIMFGKSFLGIKRMSYLIDPKGRIFKIYRSVKPAEHAKQVLKDLQAEIKKTR